MSLSHFFLLYTFHKPVLLQNLSSRPPKKKKNAFSFVVDVLSNQHRLPLPTHTVHLHTFASALRYFFISSDLSLRQDPCLLCLCLTLVLRHLMKWLLTEQALLSEEPKTETGTPLSTMGKCLIHWAAHIHTHRTAEQCAALKKPFVHCLALKMSERIRFHL